MRALDLLRVGDLDVPALLLERVVDEPGAGHRLDDLDAATVILDPERGSGLGIREVRSDRTA